MGLDVHDRRDHDDSLMIAAVWGVSPTAGGAALAQLPCPARPPGDGASGVALGPLVQRVVGNRDAVMLLGPVRFGVGLRAPLVGPGIVPRLVSRLWFGHVSTLPSVSRSDRPGARAGTPLRHRDLDPARDDAGLQQRLAVRGRPTHDGTVAQPERAAVPWAYHALHAVEVNPFAAAE